MSAFSRLVLRIARWIAGAERAEWVHAMEAEAASIDGDSTMWAFGCVWASMKDRVVRERLFLVAILFLPIGAVLLSLALFFPLAWLFHHGWLPAWVLVGSGLLSPLPFAFILGRIGRGLASYFAALFCFGLEVFIPLVVFWAKFGKSPFSWFGDDATWYNMTPVAGLTSAFLVWVVGVWLGSHSRRAVA